MADDKKNIPEAAPPTEAPAPAVENAAVLEQPSPGPALTDAEAVMLEHEGQAALFEMGEAVPDPADAVTYTEVEEPAAPEVPKAEKEQAQPPDPGKDAPAPEHSGKVVDFATARDEADTAVDGLALLVEFGLVVRHDSHRAVFVEISGDLGKLEAEFWQFLHGKLK